MNRGTRFELKTTSLKIPLDSGAQAEIKKRKDALAVTAATKLKKSLRSSSSTTTTSTSTPSSTSNAIPGSRKLKKTVNGRASASEQQHIGQPSKLFLMLLNSKATLIQRWWRSLRRNAPSFIPNEKLLTVKEDDPVQDEQTEVVRKRRQAIAEQARLVLLFSYRFNLTSIFFKNIRRCCAI